MRKTTILAAFALTVGPAAWAQPAKLSCAGSEPFWSLAIDGATARLASPNAELMRSGATFTGKMTEVANHNPPISVWRGNAVAVIVPQACGVPSGEELPYKVWLSLPSGEALWGCCR